MDNSIFCFTSKYFTVLLSVTDSAVFYTVEEYHLLIP